jgi:hypothetical protein
MAFTGCISTKSGLASLPAMEAGMAGIFERLLAVWISAFAAFTFLFALVLAVVHVISWAQVAYVYAIITGITLLLAGLCYAWKSRD